MCHTGRNRSGDDDGVLKSIDEMGGPVRNDLSSHRRDDRQYDQKRRDLRKHLPAIREYIDCKRQSGDTGSLDFRVLEDLAQNLTTSSTRVPMFVLLRGEEAFKRQVLRKDETNQSLMEAFWRLPSFRDGVVQKLSDAVDRFGRVLNKSPRHMEEYIFERSRTREEYLESAARVVVFFQKNSERTEQVVSTGSDPRLLQQQQSTESDSGQPQAAAAAAGTAAATSVAAAAAAGGEAVAAEGNELCPEVRAHCLERAR